MDRMKVINERDRPTPQKPKALDTPEVMESGPIDADFPDIIYAMMDSNDDVVYSDAVADDVFAVEYRKVKSGITAVRVSFQND